MLLKDNLQHVPALSAILAACSSVRAYDVSGEYIFNINFLLGGALDHDDMTRAMMAIWKEAKAPIRVQLSGAYYASIKPTIDGRYAAFDVVFTSNDKRRSLSVHTEHYNVIGGYWYTPQADLNATGTKALASNLMTSITAIVRAFNRAGYNRA